MTWPAASAWTTLAPPPGTTKSGALRPSASKNFFCTATRCCPYTNVDTLWDAVIVLSAWAWPARTHAGTAAAPAATAVAPRNARRVTARPPVFADMSSSSREMDGRAPGAASTNRADSTCQTRRLSTAARSKTLTEKEFWDTFQWW